MNGHVGDGREEEARSTDSLIHLNRVTVNSEANARRIALVESCFGGAGQPLQVPGRVLVGEGVLTKSCRKKPKPRQFFLFNDLLVYGNIIINKKKYNKQHIIPLEEVRRRCWKMKNKIFTPAKSWRLDNNICYRSS